MAKIKMLCATVILGTIGLFVKYVPLASHLTVLFRVGFAAFAIGLYFLLSGKKLQLQATKKDIFLLLTSGACLALNFVFLFEAYKHIPYSIATVCDYFAPVIVMVLSPLVFREKLTAKQILCFGMCTLGLLLLLGVGNESVTLSLLGVTVGLIGMLFYVPVLMLNKAIKNVGNLERTFLQLLVALIVLLALLPFGEKPDFSQMTWTSWAHLLVIGTVHTGVAYCLMFSALPKLSGQEGALLTYIDPFVAVMVSVFVMQEPIAYMQIIGGILLLGFMLLNELTGNKKK